MCVDDRISTTFFFLRYIQVDIDDVFVGKNRLLVTDVKRMMDSQRKIEKSVPGFRYNLGFSGKSFRSGH